MLRVLCGALALATLASAEITIPADPFADMPHDYRNWAAVMSQVFLKKEGSEEGATGALARVMLAAHGHLARVANGGELFPRFHLTDPLFAAETHDLGDALQEVVGKISGKVKGKLDTTKKVTPFAASKTFFNFAPCVLQETHTGFEGHLHGLNFAPELFGFHPTVGRASFSALQIAPKLIFLNPMGLQVQPQGLNIQPILAYIGPIGANIQPQGLNVQPIKLNISPVGKNIQAQGKVVAPAKLVYAPTKVLYNPRKGPVYAPVGDDLAATGTAAEFGQTEGGSSTEVGNTVAP